MNKQLYETIGETLYKEELGNGLTVFLLPKQEMSKTYAIFGTNYGSIDQDFVPIGSKERVHVPEGIAHFLEHKLFESEKGDVFQDFGKQGASANAFTSFTSTAYLFSATDNIIENTRTLIDFVQDPYFTEQSVEKEKGIIAQEIRMYDDQPDWQSFMGTIKAMFHNHPVNIDIAGTVESIQDITKDDLYTCYNTFYHPENMTLFIAGNFIAEEMLDMIRDNQAKKQFAQMEQIKRFYPEEPETVVEKKKVVQMPVSIPKSIVGIKEKHVPSDPLEFIKTDLFLDIIMDHYYSKGGKYYQELYQSGLVDSSFYYDTSLEKNFGYSMIGGNTEKPDEFAEKVKEQLLSLADEEINENRFEVLKRKKIGQVLRSMNSMEYIANQYIHYNSIGFDFLQLVPVLESLKAEELNGFMNNWIAEDRLAVFQITPESK
ncbi:pitrilysin family protein [Aciduricibacillus chroicocephali]|uniref:Pitrilysin family protein n=1 Tax=Aciduricibacillus chroicocephali TaxID=3054939 RepID=A0ABY9L1Y6_9BACI|nr:pitrilysin family protein [Bacillaceae bacterium 44XB]